MSHANGSQLALPWKCSGYTWLWLMVWVARVSIWLSAASHYSECLKQRPSFANGQHAHSALWDLSSNLQEPGAVSSVILWSTVSRAKRFWHRSSSSRVRTFLRHLNWHGLRQYRGTLHSRNQARPVNEQKWDKPVFSQRRAARFEIFQSRTPSWCLAVPPFA